MTISKPHKELAFIIDRALASPYGVPYDESHEAREALDSLVEQLEASRTIIEAVAHGKVGPAHGVLARDLLSNPASVGSSDEAGGAPTSPATYPAKERQ